MQKSISRQIAEFAIKLKYEDLPKEVVNEADDSRRSAAEASGMFSVLIFAMCKRIASPATNPNMMYADMEFG